MPPWFCFGIPQKLSRLSSMFVPPEDKIPRPSPAGFWQRRVRAEGVAERPTRFPCVDFPGPLAAQSVLRHGHLPWAAALGIPGEVGG